MISLALLLAMQGAPAGPVQQPVETTPAPWPDPERELGMIDQYSTQDTDEARRTMMRFAECVAEGSADKAADVLGRDFRSSGYRSALQNLSRSNEGCARKVGLSGRMRMSNLAFAGALAEALVERRGAPAQALLARAAAGEAAPTWSPSDAVAMCMVRSVPNEVATLFAADVGSAEETSAVAALGQPAQLCASAAKVTKPLSISPSGLRAMLATASLRSIARLKDV